MDVLRRDLEKLIVLVAIIIGVLCLVVALAAAQEWAWSGAVLGITILCFGGMALIYTQLVYVRENHEYILERRGVYVTTLSSRLKGHFVPLLRVLYRIAARVFMGFSAQPIFLGQENSLDFAQAHMWFTKAYAVFRVKYSKKVVYCSTTLDGSGNVLRGMVSSVYQAVQNIEDAFQTAVRNAGLDDVMYMAGPELEAAVKGNNQALAGGLLLLPIQAERFAEVLDELGYELAFVMLAGGQLPPEVVQSKIERLRARHQVEIEREERSALADYLQEIQDRFKVTPAAAMDHLETMLRFEVLRSMRFMFMGLPIGAGAVPPQQFGNALSQIQSLFREPQAQQTGGTQQAQTTGQQATGQGI